MKRLLPFLCYALLGTLAAQSQSSTGSEPKNELAQNTTASQSTKENTSQSESAQAPDKKENHHTRWHIAPSISVGYAHLSGPVLFNPFYPYGFYPYGLYPTDFIYGGYESYPFGYTPFYAPYYYPPNAFDRSAGRGQVKLSGAAKDAQVYLDGAYAGTADHLKNMWLDPGAYNLEVSTPAGQKFQKRIYVLSGKILKVNAQLSQAEKSK